MRLLVCGGRGFNNGEAIRNRLDRMHTTQPISVLMTTSAYGADTLAHTWALVRNVPSIVFNANWNTYGRKGGRLRNQRMIDEGKPDLVLAFPGGRGTADICRRARKAGITVRDALEEPSRSKIRVESQSSGGGNGGGS